MRLLATVVTSAVLLACNSELSLQANQEESAEQESAEEESAEQESAEQEKYPAPPIRGTYLYGGTPFTYDYGDAEFTVVNFWNPYCLGSELEAKSLQQFALDHPDARVLGITDPVYERKVLISFASRGGWTFTALIDDGTANRFEPGMPLPTSFIVNREGMVVAKIVNYMAWQSTEMEDVVEHVRNGKLIWYERSLTRWK